MSLSRSDSGEGIFLHPDALPCLKRSQLQSLCGRLGLKATGKNSELIDRLLAFANETNSAEGPTEGRFVVLRPIKPSSSSEEVDSAVDDAGLARSRSPSSTITSCSSLAESIATRSTASSTMRTLRSTRSRAKALADETQDDMSTDISMTEATSMASIESEVAEQPVRRSARSRKTLAKLDAAPQLTVAESRTGLGNVEREQGEVKEAEQAVQDRTTTEPQQQQGEEDLTPAGTPKASTRKAKACLTPRQTPVSRPSGMPKPRRSSSSLLSTSSTPKVAGNARLASTPRAHAASRLSQTPRVAAVPSPRNCASPRPVASPRSITSPRVSATPRFGQSSSARKLATPRQSMTPARSRLAEHTPLRPSPASHLADREPWEHVSGETKSPSASLSHTDYHLEAQEEDRETASSAARPAMTRDHTMTLSEFGIDGAQGTAASGSESSIKSRGARSHMSKSGSLRSLSSSVHGLGRGIMDKVGEVAKRAGAAGKRKREGEDERETRARDSVLVSTNEDGDISMHTTCDEDEVAEMAPIETPRPIRGRPSRARQSRAILSPEPVSAIYPALPEPMAASIYPTLPSPTSIALPASPVSPPTVSSQGFSEAANRVLAEMNARLTAAGRGPMAGLPTESTWSVSGVNSAHQGSIRTRMAMGPASRYDGTHAKHFDKMDSIANHYAAKRSGPASASTSTNATAAPCTKRVKVDAAASSNGASVAAPRSVSGTAATIKTAKEQEVIRRKLQVARARRRSLGGPKTKAAAAHKSSGLAQRFGDRIAQAVGKAVDGVRRAMPSASAVATPTSTETVPVPPLKEHGKKPSLDPKTNLNNKPSWGTKGGSSAASSAASKGPETARAPETSGDASSSAIGKASVHRPISQQMKVGSKPIAPPARSSSKVLSPAGATSVHDRQMAKKRAVMGLSPKVAASFRPVPARTVPPSAVASPTLAAPSSTTQRTMVSPAQTQPGTSGPSVSGARKVRSSMGASARGSSSLTAGSTIASRKRAEIIRASREAQAQAKGHQNGLLSPSASTMRGGAGQLRRKPANASLAATAAAQAHTKAGVPPPSCPPEASQKPNSPLRRLQNSPARKLGSAGRGKGGFRTMMTSESEEENIARDEDRKPHDSASFEDLASTILYAVS